MEKPPLYQIVNWEQTFENNKSRETGRCSFVCVPNRHGGLGLSAVLSEPDGRNIYGIWALIVQYCSRHLKPRAGWLTHDGRREGTRTTAAEIALGYRCQHVAEVYRMLQVTSRPDVGWLELVEGVPEYSQKREAEVSAGGQLVPPRGTAGAVSALKEGRNEGKKSGNEAVPTTTVLLSQNCEKQEGMQYHEAKLWLNGLFDNNRPWTYEEDQLLSEALPIDNDTRALIEWAFKLPRDSPLHEMTILRQKRVTLLRDLGGECDKLKMMRKKMGYNGLVGVKKT